MTNPAVDPKGYIFRQQLRTAREAQGLTQVELENKCGCKIAHLETGSRLPSFETLRSLCVALGVSADYLVFGKRDDVETMNRAGAFLKIKAIVEGLS